MLGSIGRRSNSSSWRGWGRWGRSRRVRLFAALSLAAVVLAAALAGVAVPAQAAPQRAAVSGLTAQPGDNPGELIVAWDAHPDGATDYRVALAPADGEYSPWRDSTWNAYPAGASCDIQRPRARRRIQAESTRPVQARGSRRQTQRLVPSSQRRRSRHCPASRRLMTVRRATRRPARSAKRSPHPCRTDPSPRPGIETRDHTPTSTTTSGRSPGYPIAAHSECRRRRYPRPPVRSTCRKRDTHVSTRTPIINTARALSLLYDTGGDRVQEALLVVHADQRCFRQNQSSQSSHFPVRR